MIVHSLFRSWNRARFRYPIYLSVIFLPFLAGCTLFHLSVLPGDRDSSAASNVPQLPGKHSQRVSQFVFFSDFELKTDQQLFRELSDMREQVVKDLRLPSPNTLVTVYLFEDRD